MAENEIVDTGDQISGDQITKNTRIELQKSYANWSMGLAGLGILNLVLSFFGLTSVSMAIIFLIAAAVTYFFRVTAMFLVIGVLLIWTAIGNLLAVVFNDQAFFALDILIFLILAYRAIRKFREFRSYDDEIANSSTDVTDDPQSRLALARRVFPAGGCVITILSMGTFAFVWLVTAFIVGFDSTISTLAFENTIYTTTLSVCVFAFAVSLASFLSGYGRKRLAVAGMISAVMAFICQLSFFPG